MPVAPISSLGGGAGSGSGNNRLEVSTLLELSVVWVARAAVIPAAAPRIMPAAGYTARWH